MKEIGTPRPNAADIPLAVEHTQVFYNRAILRLAWDDSAKEKVCTAQVFPQGNSVTNQAVSNLTRSCTVLGAEDKSSTLAPR